MFKKLNMNSNHVVCFLSDKRKPNDCVVNGAILHELRNQQCHTRPKVECGAAGFSMRGV